MSSNKQFIKDVFWNISSYTIPILIAIPMFGVLARSLGVEKFGVFTLLLTVFGYASIFDLGLSRAVVRSISINKASKILVLEYLYTSISTIIPISLTFSLVFYLCAPSIVSLLNISDAIFVDANKSLELMSLAFFPLLTFSVMQGYYEGLEKFKTASIIKIQTSILLSVLPVLCVWYHPSLQSAVFGLLLARIYAFFISGYIIYKENKTVSVAYFDRDKFYELFEYGKWLVITNIVSPILTTVDRFVLSSIGGANKVAFYTGPSEIVSRVLIIPGIVTRTLFPKLARGVGKDLEKRLSLIFFSMMLIIVIGLIIFSKLIIVTWLGQEYAQASTTLQILSIGLFFCSLAQLPYTSIQASGHSKVVALIHAFELIPYITLLYFCVEKYSYIGVAVVWSIRMSVDYVLLYVIDRIIKKRSYINSRVN